MINPTFHIASLFSSIQGEGLAAGLPCTFIRLSGCNLACPWCDTAWARTQGRQLTLGAILKDVTSRGISLITVTGGEPLLQEHTFLLLATLVDKGFSVLLETNGSLSLEGIPRGVTTILDVKCPDSGMSRHNFSGNIRLLQPGDQIKFVVASRDDYEWARTFVTRESIPPACHILISPVHGAIDARLIAEWLLKDKLDARLNLQLHKVIWNDDTNEH